MSLRAGILFLMEDGVVRQEHIRQRVEDRHTLPPRPPAQPSQHTVSNTKQSTHNTTAIDRVLAVAWKRLGSQQNAPCTLRCRYVYQPGRLLLACKQPVLATQRHHHRNTTG